MWKANGSTWHERTWDKEDNLSPRQESNPWPPEHRAGALSTELRELMETGILHSARISTVEVWLVKKSTIFIHFSKKYLVY